MNKKSVHSILMSLFFGSLAVPQLSVATQNSVASANAMRNLASSESSKIASPKFSAKKLSVVNINQEDSRNEKANQKTSETDSDQANFSKARRLFEQKKFSDALAEYKKIQPSSDRYLLAVEEKAWTYLHLNQYDKALAEVRTLTSPALAGLVTSEPYLLQALTQLKICDYVAVFQTLKEFKINKKAQIEAIQQLAKNRRNAISRTTLDQWVMNPENWKSLGPALGQMPQLFYRDSAMIKGAQEKNFVALETRLQQLAVQENNENFRILQKLNLIEVESIQRVHIASEFDSKQGEVTEKGKHDLVFKDSSEVWLDELDSFQATVNLCKKKSGRTM